MDKDTGFLDVKRRTADKLPVDKRLADYREVYLELAEDELRAQASRCMECGVPFCHAFGCPLGNAIPEWNELVYRGRWREAADLLHATNNFPEITGRVCPALCEAACVLSLGDEAVTVRQDELAIVERAFKEGWIEPEPPLAETGWRVAVIGSGPAGMAAAQQLRRAGHEVTLFEQADRPGGILRYGIPDFKLEKWVLERRFEQLESEGVELEVGVEAGRDVSARYLRQRFDAVCLAIGSARPRELAVSGSELKGIHQAMDFLIQQNRRVAGLPIIGEEISAQGKRVVIIGGGDTGSDCLGTALRQGASSVVQLEILPQPPAGQNPATPWPQYPNISRTSTSHEEGGERRWSVCTKKFSGRKGQLTGLAGVEVEWGKAADGRPTMTEVAGSQFKLKADLALLAMGFVGVEPGGLLEGLGVECDARGSVKVDADHRTGVEGVFAAGDATTGPWLVVHAIAAGRRMARAVDLELMGETRLPAPPAASPKDKG
ncbi:glutamate synthase subunit beta [Candidatus Sumerlaeota bacterium]